MKKVLKLVFGLTFTLIFSLGFFVLGENMNHFKYDDPSETFIGVLSSYSYNSKADTAKAFLANELTGITSQPVYNNYQKIKELDENEIDALFIEKTLKSKIDSAEDITIFYSCDGEEKRSSTCLLTMGDEYRYYVSISNVGEAITNSYFDSVLDGSKYLNCTSTTTVNFRLINPKATTDATYRQTIMFDKDVAYFDQEFPGMNFKAYFKETINGIVPYLEHPTDDDGKFHSLTEINRDLSSQYLRYEVYLSKGGETINIESLDTLQDVTDFMFTMPVDASYFVKTPYGFSMPNNKYKAVCKLMAGEDAYQEIEQTWSEHHIYFNSDYYVSEGRLSASKTVLTMSDGEDVFALTIIVNYTDFGSTKVNFLNEVDNGK